MGKALPAAIAGRCHAHQPCVLPVLHETYQNPVFYKGIFTAGGALIIYGDGSSTVWDGAIIEHCHAGCGYSLAHKPGKGGSALAVKITL